MNKETRTENVILESYGDIELLVTYTYEHIKSQEECHGIHDTSYLDIDISHVELIIAGESVKVNGKSNILMSLTPRQRNEIESQLQVH